MPTIDVVIPCFRAAATLARAVHSAAAQPQVARIYLIDDASDDGTADEMRCLAAQYPQIVCCFLTHNGGAAAARNYGAWQSSAEVLAFLDADDEYEAGALEAAAFAFGQHPHIGTIRLRLTAVGLPDEYRAAPGFAEAWQRLAMTVGGNMLVRRSLFLAAGGFPQHELFRRLGGEDAALGVALTRSSVVATLFGEHEPGVRHTCHPHAHAYRLLDSALFGRAPGPVSREDLAESERITAQIAASLMSLRQCLEGDCGIMPLYPQRD